MPVAGQKRGPRLPQGPKPIDEVEDRVIDVEVVDVVDDPELSTTPMLVTTEVKEVTGATGTIGATGTTEGKEAKKEDSNFNELKRVKVPEPPTRVFGNWEGFDKYQSSLKREVWDQILWYLYRLYPKIVRPHNEGYIDKGGGKPLTLSYILTTHGSGDYQVILNDPSMPKLQRKICSVTFKHDDIDHPPLLNMGELDVDYRGNKLFVDQCIARGLLTTEKKPMNSLQSTQSGEQGQLVRLLEKLIDKKDQPVNNGKDPRDSALAEVISIMGKGNEAATKMLVEQIQAASRNDDPDRLLKLVQMIVNMREGAQQNSNSSSGDTFKWLELLSKKDEKIMGLVEKLMEAKMGGGEGGKEDSFDTFLDRMAKWNEATGLVGGLAGGREGKKSTLEVILQYSMPAVEKALGLVQNLLYLKGQGVQANTGTTTVDAKASTTRTAPGGGGGGQLGPVAVSSPADGPQDVRDAMLGEAEQNQVNVIRNGVRQLGPQIIAAMERGTEGDAFAESINNFLGPMAYNQIAALGEERIVEYLKLEPTVWARLATVEPALKVFIKEFIAYGTGTGGEVDEEPSEDDLKAEAERKKQAAAFEGTGGGRRGVVS